MGTWGMDLFDDDLAMDIKSEFEEALEDGLNAKEASKQILQSYEDVLEDEDEGPLVYLVLAALQLKEGSVQNNIRKKALEIIESGDGLGRWEEAGEEALRQRVQALNILKDQLSK